MTTTTLSFDAFNPGIGFTFNSAYKLRFHPVDKVWKPHNGGDFAAAPGTPLRAAADGVVFKVLTDQESSYGYAVVLKHTREDGSIFYSLEGHLQGLPTVKVGDRVAGGDVIGAVGSTGKSDGPHLHFEIIKDQPSPLALGHATENPATFTNWGGLPHIVGTDNSGNPLIAQTTGSPQTGDYARIVMVRDRTTGAVIGTYGTTYYALTDQDGATVGYRLITKGDVGSPISIETVDNQGNLLKAEMLDPQGQTTSIWQAGIRIDIGANGQKIAYVPGYEGGITVSANGDIVLNMSGRNITLHLADDPVSGTNTCVAGNMSSNFTGAESVAACFNGVMIYGAGETQVSDRLIDGEGQTIEFDYSRIFEFGGAEGEWRLTNVEPILLADAGGTLSDVPRGLFTYDNGILSVSGNTATGDYLMNVPNADGGQTIYGRTVDGTGGYDVHQTSSDGQGRVTFDYSGHQATADGSIVDESITATDYDGPVTSIRNDTNADGTWDDIQTETQLSGTQVLIEDDGNADGFIDARYLDDGAGAPAALTDLDTIVDIESRLADLDTAGLLADGMWTAYTDWTTSLLVADGGGVVMPLPFDLLFDPIGAFYDSQSSAHDVAPSIAAHTPVALDASLQPVTATQLAARDADGDGRLAGTELAGVNLWRDLNENGLLDAGEIGAAAAPIDAADYGLLTLGNGRIGGVVPVEPIVPVLDETVPNSNYRTLRDTDNVYAVPGGAIVWTASQIKINYNNKSYLIGTDGNDAFDSNYYAAYPQYFNINLLVNFLGGSGNDTVGGSSRDDNVWGGSGNDILFGYAGADKLYGEDGTDEFQGNEGNDTLNGGLDNDRLFGQVGNDILIGGGGDDILVGFTGANEAKQTLNAGETDDDILSGGNGNDNLFGGLGNDSLDGGAGNDLAVGGDGNDLVFGGAGRDELQGGSGTDRLVGGADDDRLFGQVGNDTLWGGDGNDIIYGFTGTNEAKQTLNAGESDDDALYGGAGSDILVGGLGMDTCRGGTGRDELQGGAGDDMLYGEEDADNLFGQVGNDVLYGGDGDDYLQGFTGSNEAKQTLAAGETDDDKLYGGAGADILVGGLGNDTLDGGAGADVMVGGAGSDIYVVNSVNDAIYEGADAGYDTVITSTNYLLNANVEELRLLDGFAIHGTGNALDNLIIGNDADNILDGITGADTMIGGAGDDTYYVDNPADAVVERAGEGTDTVQSSIDYTLAIDVENLILLDFSKPEQGLVDGQSVLVYGYPKRNELDYMQGDAVENYWGTCALTAIANLLTQSGAPTSEYQIVNLAINNNWTVNNPDLPAWKLGGSTVADQRAILDSYQIRNEVMTGYSEAALANLIRGGRGVIVAVNAGVLWGEPVYAGNGAVNHAITLTGVVYSAADGSLAGFYIADSGRGDVRDMTRFVDIATFRAAANVPNGYAIYSIDPIKLWDEDIAGTGNDVDNLLVGNRGNNLLSGLGGNDMLEGDAGDDVLDGGAGADTLSGGAGSDAYFVDSLADTVIEDAGEGIDRVNSSVTYTLSANVENLTLTGTTAINGTGNDLDNYLTGNAKTNYLDGGLGADTMAGGAGADVYYVDNIGDVVLENANEGIDKIVASVTWSLNDGDNVEKLSLSGTAAIDGKGNELDNTLVGNTAANVLDGKAGNDTISGGNGNDTLIGGTGNDSMTGGTGSDVYYVDSQGDTVYEVPSQGTDSVISTVNWTLGANVENLTLAGISGSEPLAGTGNELANVLTGNAGSNLLAGLDGNDTLDGGAGDDTMVGGLGDDAYVVDAAGDSVIENADEGTDRVTSAITYALEANVENLTLLASAGAINGSGNELANVLVGNNAANALYGLAGSDTLTGWGGADTLDGGLGADSMAGGAGNDTYYVDNVGDVIVELVSQGTDKILADVSWTLGDNIETLTLRSAAGISDGTGNALANTLTGNGYANVLSGLEGNDTISAGNGTDTLVGGLGADTLTGGGGNDVFRYGSPDDGGDTIVDFAVGADKLEFVSESFADLPAGTLSADNFQLGTVASGPQAMFLYDPTTGILAFDRDGAGTTAAITIATISNLAALQATDIRVAAA